MTESLKQVAAEAYEALAGEPAVDGNPNWEGFKSAFILAQGLYQEVIADHKALVRELDVLINGADRAAQQASLCDIVSQVRSQGLVADTPWNTGKPASAGHYLTVVKTDSGPEIHTLEFNGKNWIHEGEPTFCHGYYFEPVLWKEKPPIPDLPEDEE